MDCQPPKPYQPATPRSNARPRGDQPKPLNFRERGNTPNTIRPVVIPNNSNNCKGTPYDNAPPPDCPPIPAGFDAIIRISWLGHPDLDIRVECLGEAVGWHVGDSGTVLQWTSGDNTSGGPETVYVSRAAAEAAGLVARGQPINVGIGGAFYEPRQKTPGFGVVAEIWTMDGRYITRAISAGMQGSGCQSCSAWVTI